MSKIKSCLSFFLSLTILLTMVPAISLSASAESNEPETISYIDKDGNIAHIPLSNITKLTATTTPDQIDKEGNQFLCSATYKETWYYVTGETKISNRLVVSYTDAKWNVPCTVNIILMDKCTLYADQGIDVNAGKNPKPGEAGDTTSTLNIFAQSTDPNTRGKLIADPQIPAGKKVARDGDATIGAERTDGDKVVVDCGNINIYGGDLTVRSHDKSVAIGGGSGRAWWGENFPGTAGGNITFKNCHVVAEVDDKNDTSSPIGGGAPWTSDDGLRGAAANVTVSGNCQSVDCWEIKSSGGARVLDNSKVSPNDNYAHFNEPYSNENAKTVSTYPKVKKIEIDCYDNHFHFENRLSKFKAFTDQTDAGKYKDHTVTCYNCGTTDLTCPGKINIAKSDNNTHTYNCTACDYSDEVAHTASKYTDNGDGTHTVSCVCEHVINKSADHDITGVDYTYDDTHHYKQCIYCDAKVDQVEHSYDFKMNTPATCEADEIDIGTCICGKTTSKTIENTKLGHSFTKYVDTGKGKHNIVCATCGTVKTSENHDWGSGTVTTLATETQKGVKTFTCAKCGATKNEDIPMLPQHQTENKPEVSVNRISNALKVNKKTATKIQRVAKQYNVSAKTLAITSKRITAKSTDKDIAGSDFGKLKAHATKIKNNSFKLKWTKIKGASGYLIYGNQCSIKGKKYKLQLVKTIRNKKASLAVKKLKPQTSYKYLVVAYKTVGNIKATLAMSVMLHITTIGGKYGNAKAVKINKIGKSRFKSKLTLKKGKTATIKAKEVLQDKTKKLLKHRKLCFESSNKSIATVTKKGKIKAVHAGKCKIWVYAQNGVFKTINLTVK